MNFKKITDDLFAAVSHDDLAAAAGVSVATIRQARLDEDAKAHRSPPPGWERAVLKLAENKAKHFARLAMRLRAAASHGDTQPDEFTLSNELFSGRLIERPR